MNIFAFCSWKVSTAGTRTQSHQINCKARQVGQSYDPRCFPFIGLSEKKKKWGIGLDFGVGGLIAPCRKSLNTLYSIKYVSERVDLYPGAGKSFSVN